MELSFFWSITTPSGGTVILLFWAPIVLMDRLGGEGRIPINMRSGDIGSTTRCT